MTRSLRSTGITPLQRYKETELSAAARFRASAFATRRMTNDKDYTRSRTGGCCHHRRTGICWKLLWAVQPQLGLLTLSWGEHVLESPSNPKNAMKRIAFEVGFMPWNTPAVTRGQGRSSIMGAVAMLFLMIVTIPSALAEGSWCANYSGTGGTNCGFYSFQQCMAAVSGAGGFCTPNGFSGYQNYPRTRTRR